MASFLAWAVFSLSGWFSQPPRIGFTAGNLIAGFPLVDLLAISVVLPVNILLIGLFLLLFIATLKMQRVISGT